MNPFFEMLPEEIRPVGVMLGTAAAIIASQALVTGSFTLVSEASRLDLMPHMQIVYPSMIKGQIFIPVSYTHLDLEQIQVVVQPQSVIHSMVEFVDGGIIAQLGTPDMRLPIQYALYGGERRYLPGERLDFAKLGSITFEEPDMDTFKGLPLAMEASKKGGSMPTVFNAANEKMCIRDSNIVTGGFVVCQGTSLIIRNL